MLGMGTWGMGGQYERDESSIKESVTALQYGLELGFKLIDTAELYGAGLSENIVGKSIENLPRESIFIITKVWKNNLRYKDVIKSAASSLNRLQTDYIDLYLIHWPNEQIPLQETMEALERLVDEKNIKAIGVSNFSVELIEEAQKYLKHEKIIANQIEYNLLERSAEKDVIPFCQKQNIKIIAYRPLAKGVLTTDNYKILDMVGQKYKKTPVQVALNWLLSQNIVAIPKAINQSHLQENYGALDWILGDGDIELLRSKII